MVKVIKSLTLDVDIAEKLDREGNISEFINNLASQYYSNKNNQEKTIEDKIKELDFLIDDSIRQKEALRKQMDAELQIQTKALNAIRDEQWKKLQENAALLESQMDLCIEILNEGQHAFDQSFQIDMTNKFRDRGLRIGIMQIQDYLKAKGIFEVKKDG